MVLEIPKRYEKAFDFAADVTKQLITLASAIIAVTVTFSKDTPPAARPWAFGAWIAFIFSIAFGIAVLEALTAEMQPQDEATAQKQAPSIWSRNVRFFSMLQVAIFLLGVLLTSGFGVRAMKAPTGEKAELQSHREQPTATEVFHLRFNARSSVRRLWRRTPQGTAITPIHRFRTTTPQRTAASWK